jgi:hypothetical protein
MLRALSPPFGKGSSDNNMTEQRVPKRRSSGLMRRGHSIAMAEEQQGAGADAAVPDFVRLLLDEP